MAEKVWKVGDTVFTVDLMEQDGQWTSEGPFEVDQVCKDKLHASSSFGTDRGQWYPFKDCFEDFGTAIAVALARNYGW